MGDRVAGQHALGHNVGSELWETASRLTTALVDSSCRFCVDIQVLAA